MRWMVLAAHLHLTLEWFQQLECHLFSSRFHKTELSVCKTMTRSNHLQIQHIISARKASNSKGYARQPAAIAVKFRCLPLWKEFRAMKINNHTSSTQWALQRITDLCGRTGLLTEVSQMLSLFTKDVLSRVASGLDTDSMYEDACLVFVQYKTVELVVPAGV